MDALVGDEEAPPFGFLRKGAGTVARELDLTETALRRWVAQAEIDAGCGHGGTPTTDERTELAQPRWENKTLRMGRDILKQAMAFFAKERRGLPHEDALDGVQAPGYGAGPVPSPRWRAPPAARPQNGSP